MVTEKTKAQRRIAEFLTSNEEPKPAPTPEEKVDALMAAIDDLASLARDANANQRIRELVLWLGVFVGLEFDERMWGKRPIRALRQGMIAFGEANLPMPLHGRTRVDAAESASAWACCRGPSADAGPRRGARGRKGRTDEPDSGSEQTHQGTNVGATGLEPATS